VDTSDHLKYIDFSCFSIDGKISLLFYSTRNSSPRFNTLNESPNISVETWLFTLGSVQYEIETGHVLYEGLKDDQVEKMYKVLECPDVSRLCTGDIIRKCWNAEYENVGRGIERSSGSAPKGMWMRRAGMEGWTCK